MRSSVTRRDIRTYPRDRFISRIEEYHRLSKYGLPNSATIRAWDLPTRLFKWALVVGIILAYGSTYLSDPSMALHKVSGYFVLSLIVFRLAWGLMGASTARFSSFVRGPRVVASYLLAIVGGRNPKYIGHNPAGALMVVTLLALTAIQGMTGLFSNDGVFANGPFSEAVRDDTSDILTLVHKFGVYVLMCAIVVHVVANVYYQLVKRDPLITAIVIGVKPADSDYADVAAKGGAGIFTALVLFALSAVVVVGSIWWFNGILL
jgi:cytochrome b